MKKFEARPYETGDAGEKNQWGVFDVESNRFMFNVFDSEEGAKFIANELTETHALYDEYKKSKA